MLASNVSKHGTYFKKSINYVRHEKLFRKFTFRFKSLYIIFFVAYIPYYLSWPIVLLYLSKYPDYRAMIIGMSGLLNGFNTITNALIIDPKLSQMSVYKRICAQVHNDFLYLRLISALAANLIFFGVLLFF